MPPNRSYARPGAAGADLALAAKDRLEDARSLIASGRAAMAIAMGLYSLEIQLKVLICRRLDILHLPKPFEIHDLDELLVLAGPSRKIEDPTANLVKINWDNVLSLATKLNELRYSPENQWPLQQAGDFLNWLDDANHGVLTWLSSGP